MLAHLRTLGPDGCCHDGEAVFQPHKVARSGIWKAVAGNVLVYVHKELSLDDVERRYPAGRYVFVDDKLRILTAVKAFWGARVTTVLPLQGQFATDPEVAASHPAADVTIDGIAELIRLELKTVSASAPASSPHHTRRPRVTCRLPSRRRWRRARRRARRSMLS